MSTAVTAEAARAGLPWTTALRIAWREVRAARARFLFVLLSVAIGVAALTGVRGFSEAFQKALLGQARSIMAADLSARMFRQMTAQEESKLDALAKQGVERTTVTETVSMASAEHDPVPLLVSLKIVDPSAYPYYGQVSLSPSESLRQALNDSTVVVEENLLVRLHTKVGANLRIGGQGFRIAAVIVREPDRLTGGVGIGPRVFMTRSAVDRLGLLQAGSRSTERYLFRIPPQAGSIAKLRAQIEKDLPEAQVTDFRETNPALTEGLERATGMLSLISLVAMVLGAVGVAMAMRAHLQQRIEILAIMKSIGARSSDILRIYLLQTLLLGTAGALLGVLLGLGVEFIFPTVLGKLLPLRPTLQLPWRTVLASLGTGVLTTVLFCLPPLLDVRNVKPSLILRRTVDTNAGTRSRIAGRRAQWIAIAIIVAGLCGIAAALTDSLLIGVWFAGALCALLAVILLLSGVTLRSLRTFLDRYRLRLTSALRHGLANLYRPGNQTAAVLAALGTGVMLILSVFLMERSIVHEMRASAPPDSPNIFLVDITSLELPGVRALLEKQPGVQGKLDALPIVSGRITGVNGTSADALKLKNYPKRLLRSVALTWSTQQPAGVKPVEGKWWTANTGSELAVVDYAAHRLNLHPGSTVQFTVGERVIPTRVTLIYKTDGEHVYARSEFILSPSALKDAPVVWYAALHIAPARIASAERVLFAAYPTVTVINIADILETIQGLVGQITLVIRFLAAFSILSGAIILASSIASTRYRRIREVVVLKTLGATRPRIAAVFSVEFAVLGLLAGLVGVIFANLLARVLLHRLDVPFHYAPAASAVALFAAALLAVVTGWAASFRILGQKPLEVLREE